MIRQTHTYANLPVSQATYNEIKAKLTAAGYTHLVSESEITVVMDGIALVPDDEPRPPHMLSDFRKDIEGVINRYSKENGSNTPDFILAQYLTESLSAYDKAVTAREKWYGREPKQADGPPDPVGKPFLTSI